MTRRWSMVAAWLLAMMSVSGFAASRGASAQATETSQYVYALVVFGIALLAGILVWWWIDVRSRPREVPPPAAPAPIPDDLTRIEGIGPKISGLLQQAGISTFSDLAETSVGRLQSILSDAGLSALADPGSWAEQARLAAEGQWERLATLQEKLKGGRRE
jgi:hypothetical protein